MVGGVSLNSKQDFCMLTQSVQFSKSHFKTSEYLINVECIRNLNTSMNSRLIGT